MKIQARTNDSFEYYSQLFTLPLNLIIDSNPAANPKKLDAGDEINIPGFVSLPYCVKEGDTIWSVANSCKIAPDAIVILNQSANPNALIKGENLIIPKRVITPLINRKMHYDYSTMCTDILSLQNIYPFIKVNSIGESVLGNAIPEIRLGSGDKKININASFHANEWITTSIIMRFLNDYLLALTNWQAINGVFMAPFYQRISLSVVPMVNPDGVDLILNGPPESIRNDVVKINGGSTDFTAWKANIRGVDLNNQFSANWEIEKVRKEPKAPAPRDYPGEAPLTEPEAIAMAALAQNSQFDRLVALHTQGEEFYWGYEGLEPPESAAIANEFERVSGYKAVQYVDSHAGYKDWFIQEFRKPGFTLELGKGINPLPFSQFNSIYHKTLPILIASFYM